MQFFKMRDGDDGDFIYHLNLAQLVQVDTSDEEWVLTMANGEEYNLDGDNLTRFQAWFKKQDSF